MKYEIEKNPTIYEVMDVIDGTITIDLEYDDELNKERKELICNWLNLENKILENQTAYVILKKAVDIMIDSVDYRKFRRNLKRLLKQFKEGH